MWSICVEQPMVRSTNIAARPAVNVGNAERIGSVIAGTVLVLRALERPTPGRILLALGGGVLLQRGLTGYCPLYRALGRDTAAPAGRRLRHAAAADPVEVASQDSFPASDPPSWTPVEGPVSRHHPARH
jgi:hypothetical protein